jgi:hypothetical protein
MFNLKTPINPFGSGCSPLTKVDADTKAWLIETGKASEDDFEEAPEDEAGKVEESKPKTKTK